MLPILKEDCFKCHGGQEGAQGGLRLDSRTAILKGGDLGPAVRLRRTPVEQSLLLKAVHY